MYTLLYLKWITHKDLLYSTGNSAESYMAAEWEGREWIHVCVWLSPYTVHLKLLQHFNWLFAVFSCSAVSNSLRPHGLQPTRFLCPWGFSRQEYWSRLPCSPPGDLSNPGIKPRSPILQADSLPSEPPRKLLIGYTPIQDKKFF